MNNLDNVYGAIASVHRVFSARRRLLNVFSTELGRNAEYQLPGIHVKLLAIYLPLDVDRILFRSHQIELAVIAFHRV